jgi:hypothetical protein
MYAFIYFYNMSNFVLILFTKKKYAYEIYRVLPDPDRNTYLYLIKSCIPFGLVDDCKRFVVLSYKVTVVFIYLLVFSKIFNGV